MKPIREIVSQNIVKLRKEHCLTQADLAKKVNYSDKAVSRWEKGEVIPDVETLNQLSQVFAVPLTYLLEEHIETEENKTPTTTLNEILFHVFSVCVVWTFITVLFVYLQLIYNYTFWQAFVWGVPITTICLNSINKKWSKNRVFKLILQSVFTWSMIASFYLQFLTQNLWLIFIIGIPIQGALIANYFIKKKIKDF